MAKPKKQRLDPSLTDPAEPLPKKDQDALTKEMRRYIVQHLACYRTPSEIAAAVKEEFGLELSRQRIHRYDPNHSADVAQEWRDLYAETRAAYLEDVSRIGIAQQVFRLEAYDDIYRRSASKRNDVMAMQALEQAAKEVGGAFTSRREITGRDGAPLSPPSLAVYIDGKRIGGEEDEPGPSAAP